MEISYHSHDFDYEEYCRSLNGPISNLPDIVSPEEESSLPVEAWEHFYRTHSSALFFKQRSYLLKEFESVFNSLSESHEDICILEVGCGHGCSIIPLLQALPSHYKFIASDYSEEALELFKKQLEFVENRSRISVLNWDISRPLEQETEANIVLCIFALSAVDTQRHIQCLRHMALVLEIGGLILFRDYAVNDMTMFRHEIRLDERLFQRNDGTLSFYFDKSYLCHVARAAGLEVVEMEYACVKNVNRKKQSTMNRAFLHAVFRRIA